MLGMVAIDALMEENAHLLADVQQVAGLKATIQELREQVSSEKQVCSAMLRSLVRQNEELQRQQLENNTSSMRDELSGEKKLVANRKELHC